jgi:hypothetical protein
MGWGRIDDRFDDHQKVIDLLEYEQGAAAVGLWTLCFTWAHRSTRKPGKTPGLIPASLPRRYVGPAGRELAGLLVKVGLWEERGEDGWLFHDFDKYLPTEQTRDARAEAGRKGAAARWGTKPRRGSKKQPDSNLPSDDAKLPGLDDKPAGASYGADGKAVANDGSRTPARRAISNEIASPVPEPVPPSAGEVESRKPHVGDIVAAFADGATSAGLQNPPANIRARVGKDARQLIAEGYDPEFLVGCARRMGPTGFNDLTIQARKDDAAENGTGDQRDPPADKREQAQQARAARAMERARAREEST